jgi:hypothetical protein
MTLLYAIVTTTLVFTGISVSLAQMVKAQTPPTQETTQQKLECLSGYPVTPAQGSRAVTRNEFAVGLNNCLKEVEQRINRNDYATKADLDVLIQRQQELNQQLRQLNNQVDSLSGD